MFQFKNLLCLNGNICGLTLKHTRHYTGIIQGHLNIPEVRLEPLLKAVKPYSSVPMQVQVQMPDREHSDGLHHSGVWELHNKGLQGPTQCGQVCRVHYRQGAPSPAGHLPHTKPQKSLQDFKRLLPPILQTFYSVAIWQVIPEHSVSNT